jgi:stalled ribosome rescue protein Dom34
MNPWVLLGALLACGGCFWYGTEVGADSEIAKQKKLDDVVVAVTAAAQTGAAAAIAGNKPVNQTIVQKVQHEIQTNTVYAECKHTDAGMRGINEALTGRAQPAGDSKLP